MMRNKEIVFEGCPNFARIYGNPDFVLPNVTLSKTLAKERAKKNHEERGKALEVVDHVPTRHLRRSQYTHGDGVQLLARGLVKVPQTAK